tara:strand:+ start:61 stop:396 length:336 start_codon:yes stop_codon:yes gene_type:complete
MVVWTMEVINPINPKEVLHTFEERTLVDIQRKWAEETGNNFMTVKKLYTLWKRKTSYHFRLYKRECQDTASNHKEWRIPFQETNGCAKLSNPLPIAAPRQKIKQFVILEDE